MATGKLPPLPRRLLGRPGHLGRNVARAARDIYRWIAPRLSRVGRSPECPRPLTNGARYCRQQYDPATTRSDLETVELMRDAYPHWKFSQIASGGPMAPLTRPDLTNPLIAQFLDH